MLLVVVVVVRAHRSYLIEGGNPHSIFQTPQADYFWLYIRKALILFGIIFAVIAVFTAIAQLSAALLVLSPFVALAAIIYTIRWQFILPAAAVGVNMSLKEAAAMSDGYKMAYFWGAFLVGLAFTVALWLLAALVVTSFGVDVVNDSASNSVAFMITGIITDALVVLQAAATAFALSYVYKIARDAHVETVADDFVMGKAHTPIAEPEPEPAPEPEPEEEDASDEDTADDDASEGDAAANDDEDPKIDQ